MKIQCLHSMAMRHCKYHHTAFIKRQHLSSAKMNYSLFSVDSEPHRTSSVWSPLLLRMSLLGIAPSLFYKSADGTLSVCEGKQCAEVNMRT